MSEHQAPYLGALGRSGPLFDGRERRLPRLGPRRATVETAGLKRAILELGGLPPDDDDLPPPPSFRRWREDRRETTIVQARDDDRPDVDLGVVEPSDWDSVMSEPPDRPRRTPVQELARRCRLNGLPEPQCGYVWERDRGWAFDLAWPRPRVGVVFDGGRSVGSSVPGAGWIRDASRLNEAVILGWMVLRLTPAQAWDGTGLALTARLLASPWRRL